MKAEIEQELKLQQAVAAPIQLAPDVKAVAHTEVAEEPAKKASLPKGNIPASISYGKTGFNFRTDDDKFALAIQNRIQARCAEPFDSDPRTLGDLDRNENSFMILRARTNLSGHAYMPWLKYYMQYDWSQPLLRDLNLTVDKYKWAQVRVGRGKVSYNNEHVTSSGNQQFVNRSIVNDIFTVDRQQGIEVKGNLLADKWYDLTYYVGAFSGVGVSERNNDGNMMYSGRLQWNALGGQYEIDQMMAEVNFKWRGFSMLHELHSKKIKDTVNNDTETKLLGGFIQAGYFPHQWFSAIPPGVEVAGRYAQVDMDTDRSNDKQTEFSAVFNYFLEGHFNKLSLQLSRLSVEDPRLAQKDSENRLWAQWGLSF